MGAIKIETPRFLLKKEKYKKVQPTKRIIQMVSATIKINNIHTLTQWSDLELSDEVGRNV